MKKLYSLFIGINTYDPRSRVTPLEGCLNDLSAMQDFLQEHYAQALDLSPKIVLENHDATYQNIVDYLGPKHLAKAGKDDVVLLYYSGHGTQEKAALEFKGIDPTGVQEAMVCYDSGLPGKYCLADKELRILLSEIQKKGAHLLLIYDSCHSGSISRSLDDVQQGKARQFFFPDRPEPRPYASYLNGYFAQRYPQGPNSRDLPLAAHLLMSACDRQEKAFELKTQRGMFSFNLLQVLDKTPNISYPDLYMRCQATMFRAVEKQHPQFEPLGGFNPWQKFLSLGSASNLRKKSTYLLSANAQGQWNINCGAVHGLSTELNKVTEFEILDQQTGKSLGVTAKANNIGFQDCEVNLNKVLGLEETYAARLLNLPAAPYTIALKLTDKGKKRYDAYRKGLSSEKLSPYFDLLIGKVGGKYLVEIDQQDLKIYNQENQTLIKHIRGDDDLKVFELATLIIESVAKWECSLVLDNRNTQFNRDAFSIKIKNSDTQQELNTKSFFDPNHPNTEVLNVTVAPNADGKYLLPLDLELRNTYEENLSFKALYFSRKYQILSLNRGFLTVDEIPKQAQHTETRKLTFAIPEGKKEVTETLKFIVSRTRINEEFLLEQDALDGLGEVVEFWKTRGERSKDLLDITPSVSVKKPAANDWFCKTLVIKMTALASELGPNSATLGNGKITIKGHDSFRAKVALSTAGSSTRDINSLAVLPQMLGWDSLLTLDYASRDLAGTVPDTLELNDLQNEDDLAQNPLQIELDIALKEDEYILPLTYDGEDFIPVGETNTTPAGKVEVSIREIPELKSEGRSIFRALKLCFFKVVLGEKNTNTLSRIEYKEGHVIYHEDGVVKEVEKAQKILLVIHGIIGNTKGMAQAMERATRDKSVDLVLAYDYENLNTSIPAIANKLKIALEAVGIKPDAAGNFNKEFSILAHSMGGLVSRCYIEQLDGRAVVSKLIMAGTPNGGSNFADLTKYRDHALFLLPLGLSLGLSIPAIGTIIAILKGSKSLTVTLEEMDYDHPGHFLKNLEQSSDPKVPYYIVAGDLGKFLELDGEANRLMNKLYKNLAGVLYKEPNDIAVSLPCIKQVPAQRKPAPVAVEVKCHHLNYFEVGESVEQILGFLQD